MKTLTQKQQYPVALGILLVLTVLACLRAIPIVAQESSLLLPQRQPSELLLPALEIALFQPKSGSSSFLKSQSFEVRDNNPKHKVGHGTASRRLKSAAATSPVVPKQPAQAKLQTPFPNIEASPLVSQKPIASPSEQNVTTFKEVLQYDKTGLFALKLVRIPVINKTADNIIDQTKAASDRVELPPFLISNGKSDPPATPAVKPSQLPELATQTQKKGNETTPKATPLPELPPLPTVNTALPQLAQLPTMESDKANDSVANLANANKSNQHLHEGTALAAIGANLVSRTPAAEKVNSQSDNTKSDQEQTNTLKSNSIAHKTNANTQANPLLILPPNLPPSPDKKTLASSNHLQASQTESKDVNVSKAPLPAIKTDSFDLGSLTMGFIGGGSIPDENIDVPTNKPIPTIDSAGKSPWFTKLPQDDFLIGFDNEEEIGLAQSQIFIGPNGEVRDLPQTTKYVPLPVANMNLPEGTHTAAHQGAVSTTPPAAQPPLIASLPMESNAMPSAVPGTPERVNPGMPTQQEKINQPVMTRKNNTQPAVSKAKKTDYLAKFNFGKIKLGDNTAKATKPANHKPVAPRTASKTTKDTPVHKPTNSSAHAPSGKSVASLFSGLNPFSKKKSK